jgi:hypothetical protein
MSLISRKLKMSLISKKNQVRYYSLNFISRKKVYLSMNMKMRKDKFLKFKMKKEKFLKFKRKKKIWRKHPYEGQLE